MAIDEALIRGRQAGTTPASVRYFAWAPPTESLGYGQPLDRHVDVVARRAS
jgi:lipoate-protein ligase A